jgi:hypothetical protein
MFNGYTTSTIAYNADATAIKNVLQQLQIITTVTVAFVTTAHPFACIDQKGVGKGGGFTVTFNTVQNMAGIYMYIYIYIYIFIYVFTSIHVFIYIYTCTYLYAYTLIHINKYKYT